MGKSKDLATGNSAAYVETAGDTMTGALNIAATNSKISTSNNHLILHDTAETDTGSNWWYIYRNSGEAGALRFYRGADRFKIDASGRVTMPYQPYFYAGSTYSGTLISSALMPFDTAAVNRGNHYNTSTYLFTAPISGQYLFTVSALNYPSSTTGQLYFSVNNGGFTALVRNNSIVSQQSLAGSAILNLAANDTVGVIGQLYFYASGGHGHFSGILLG